MTTISAVLTFVLFMQPAMQAPPKFSVRLLAGHESVQPGGQTELLVEIDVEQPWHIYDPIILDTGLPTEIKFTAPTGVTVGDWRFPAPALGRQAELEYLEHSGKIRALAPLRVAADLAPGQTLRLTARISALACKELCLPVSASATLELPITAEQGLPANEKLFKEAREKLAPLLAEAPYLSGSKLRFSKETIGIDEPAELIASIRVQPGYHIQDRDPGVDTLIPGRLLIEKVAGLEFAEEKDQIWPKPHVRELQYIGKVREQTGAFEIRVPFKIADQAFPSGPVNVRVLFQYQACTEAGQCFAPEMASALVRFTADTPNPPARGASAAPDEPESTQPTATPSPPTIGEPAADRLSEPAEEHNLLLILIFGFLGGLILNVMPCVLPVISIKIISFMQQGGEDPQRVLRLGLTFCAGIMVWFWLFAVLSMAGQVPLQYPSVVIAVGSILFVLALNLFGVFEITLPGAAAGKLDQVSRREGYGGAFFKGFLATLLGTACTAPFLATALVYAGSQPWFIGLLVFTAAGVGMSSPYLLLSAKPAWMKFVPKPGMWMVTFKQGMSFILLGTAVWLLWIIGRQMGADGAVWTVCFWTFLGLAAWMIGKISPLWGVGARLAMWTAACAVALLGYYFSYHVMYRPPLASVGLATPDSVTTYVAESGWENRIPWAPYAKGIAEELSRRGYTVYVDYTATWCATCLTNKAAVLETDDVRAHMRDLGVIPIKADFTSRDPEMLAEIKAFGRPTVPLNLIYPAGAPEKLIKLPVLLTKETVRAALEKAGPSRKQP